MGFEKAGDKSVVCICKACKGRVCECECVSEPKCVMSCVIVFVLDMQDLTG